MRKIAKWSFVVGSVVFGVVLLLLFVWIAEPFDLARALVEYMIPTSTKTISLECTATNEKSPADLMEIVNAQKDLYRLTLQNVTVCKIANKNLFRGRGESGLPRSEQFRMQWRQLSKGCCTAQSGRHVIIIVGETSENGSVITEAALVQSRGDYVADTWQKFIQRLRKIRESFFTG